MRAILVLRAPRAHKLSPRIEHNNGVAALARRMDRVMNIDVPMRVFTHAVRVSVPDVGRQFAPVMNTFILVLSDAGDRQPATGFVVSLDEKRNGDRRSRTFRENAPGNLRHLCTSS